VNDQVLLNYLRGLADTLPGTDAVSDLTIDSLEEIQANVAAIYADYEDNPAPAGAETLRELMLEALHLIHQGVEEYLLFSEDLQEQRLPNGLVMVEEGHDIMESIRYAIGQDQSWTSSAAVH
jgi:hypothetical protein